MVGGRLVSSFEYYFLQISFLGNSFKPSSQSVALDIIPKHLTLLLTQPNFHHIEQEQFLGEELSFE